MRGGHVAVVDDDMFDSLSRFAWYASPMTRGNGKVYAAAHGQSIGSGPATIYMHRVVIGATAGQIVDHIDRDTLNNTRPNLRLATGALNAVNRAIRPNRSGFRGVYLHHTKFVAEAQLHGRRIRRVGFECPAEAARAYDEIARDLFGEFALLNFPEGTR